MTKNKIESLFLGIIAAAGALIAEIFLINFLSIIGIIDNSKINQIFTDFSFSYILLFFVVIEELFKYFVIFFRILSISQPKNIITNSLLLGLGFSFFEIMIIFYNFASYSHAGIAELLQIFLIHTLNAGLMGYILYVNKKSFIFSIKAMAITSTLHLLINFIIILDYYSYLNFLFLLTLLLINIFNINKLRNKLAS